MGIERNEKGQFVKGNRGGPGRKPREAERRLLDLFRGCVTDADFRAIVRAAVDEAKRRGGHMSRKLLFDYLLGMPVQRVAPTDPSGEHEYSGIDLSQLTDDDLAALDAIAARARADQERATEA